MEQRSEFSHEFVPHCIVYGRECPACRECGASRVEHRALEELADEMPCTCPTSDGTHDPVTYVNCARVRALWSLKLVAAREREELRKILSIPDRAVYLDDQGREMLRADLLDWLEERSR